MKRRLFQISCIVIFICGIFLLVDIPFTQYTGTVYRPSYFNIIRIIAIIGAVLGIIIFVITAPNKD